jgi:hypothetical protein
MTDEDPRAPEIGPTSLAMDVSVANSIITRAPLTAEQLQCALDHYAALEAMLRKSGPRFTNSRRDAADMHNRALVLLRELEAKTNPPVAAPPRPHDGRQELAP